MQGYKDTDYLHISVRARVMQAKLFTEEKLLRIAAAPGAEEAYRLITEGGYDAAAADALSPRDYEKLFSYEEEQCRDFIKSLSADHLLGIFELPYDTMNLKALLKASLLSVSPEKMLVSSGHFSKEEIKKAFVEKKRDVLGERMADALEKAVLAYSADGDPRQIDLILDRACFEEMIARAEEDPFDFILDYVLTKTDLLNIRTFVRIRTANGSFSLFEAVYPGGRIPLSFYREHWDGDLSAFFTALSEQGYPMFRDLSENFSLTRLEKISDLCECAFAVKLNRYPFGPQIPVMYLLSKEFEIKNLRIIMAGKFGGLSPEEIKERMRLGYV